MVKNNKIRIELTKKLEKGIKVTNIEQAIELSFSAIFLNK